MKNKVVFLALLSVATVLVTYQSFEYLDALANNDGGLEEEYYRLLEQHLGDSPIAGSDGDFPQYHNDTQTNICTGYKDPDSMTYTEYLQAFVEGPCAPFLIVPAMIQTALEVQIDCEVLREKNYEIFRGCGWTRCDWGIFGAKPKSEYRLWFPDIDSPLNILSLFGKSAYCFSSLFALQYTEGETGRGAFYTPAGTNVTWQGNTPETKDDSKCGISADEDLVQSSLVKNRGNVGWKFITKYLTTMGFKEGITMQIIPYDWRYPVQYCDAEYTFNRSLNLLTALTGKKSVVLSHSLGVSVVAYLMTTLSQEQKDRTVSSVIGMGGPMDGAAATLDTFIGGKIATFEIDGFTIGLTYNDTMNAIKGMFTELQMLPGDSYSLGKGTGWLDTLENYIQAEQNYPPWTPEGLAFWGNRTNVEALNMSYFPNPLEQCVPDISTRKIANCLTLLTFPDYPILKVMDREYRATPEDYIKFFKTYTGYGEPSLYDKFDIALQINKSQLTNPGVPWAMVYGAFLPTPSAYYYDYDIEKNKDEEKFSNPTSNTSSVGDGTVPMSSSMLSMFKWAWEYDNQVPNSHPVRFVEYCGTYRQRGTPYDDTPLEGEWTFGKNDYIGVGCDCINDPSVGCDHDTYPEDSYVVGYTAETVINNDRKVFNETLGSKLTEAQLEEIFAECPQIYASYDIQTVEGLINTLN